MRQPAFVFVLRDWKNIGGIRKEITNSEEKVKMSEVKLWKIKSLMSEIREYNIQLQGLGKSALCAIQDFTNSGGELNTRKISGGCTKGNTRHRRGLHKDKCRG